MFRHKDDDGDDVLEDGDVLRVPLQLCDSAHRQMAERMQAILRDEQAVTDAFGNPAGNRPGFLFAPAGSAAHRQAEVNDALRITRRAMLGDRDTGPGMTRDEYVRQLSDAWRHP